MCYLIIAICVLLLLYLFWNHKQQYWLRRGIKQYAKLEDTISFILRRKHLREIVNEAYRKNERFLGIYNLFEPILLFNDPLLLRELDERSIFKSTKSRCLEHGEKLSTKISSNAKGLVRFFLNTSKNAINIELKDVFTRHLIDYYSTVLFDSKKSCFVKQDSFCEIMNTGFSWKCIVDFLQRKLLDKQYLQSLFTINPDVGKIDSYRTTLKKYFSNLEEDNEDTLSLPEEIEITSDILSLLTYELAVNPKLQEKLAKDIRDVYNANKDSSLEELEIQTLDLAIYETLRKYPIKICEDMICKEDASLNIMEHQINVRKYDKVMAPTSCMNMDERYFKEPETWNPERFICDGQSEPAVILRERLVKYFENKETIKEQIKITISHVLLNFDLLVNNKTEIPLTFQNSKNVCTKNGIWISFKRKE